MRYHLTPARIAVIKKWKNKRSWYGCGEKKMLIHCWWEFKSVQPLWKTIWRFLKELKVDLPFDLAIPLLSIYPKEKKSLHRKTPTHTCLWQHNSQLQRRENNVEIPQTTKNRTTIWSSNPTNVYLPRGKEVIKWKRYLYTRL